MSVPSSRSGIVDLARSYIALDVTLLSGEQVLAMAKALVQAEESRATNAKLLDEALQRLKERWCPVGNDVHASRSREEYPFDPVRLEGPTPLTDQRRYCVGQGPYSLVVPATFAQQLELDAANQRKGWEVARAYITEIDLLIDYDCEEDAETRLEKIRRLTRSESMHTVTPADIREIVRLVVLDVAEIPDRTSPEDQPEIMLVKDSELRRIVTARLSDAFEVDMNSDVQSERTGGS